MGLPPSRQRTKPSWAWVLSAALLLLSACGDDAFRLGEEAPRLTAAKFARLERALDDYDRRAGGDVGVAIASLRTGPVRTFGRLQQGAAWSAIKVPVVAAFLDRRRESERARNGIDTLSEEDRTLVERTIRRSDNHAASVLHSALGDTAGERQARVQGLLREAGDHRTRVPPPRNPTALTFPGTTPWRLSDGLTFYRALARGCLLTRADTEFLFDHMRRIEKVDWGVAKAYPKSLRVASKSGWGPNRNLRWLMQQFAVVSEGDTSYVIGLMAQSTVRSASPEDPSSYNAGGRMVTDLAVLVRHELERPSPVQREGGLPIRGLRQSASKDPPQKSKTQGRRPRDRGPC